MNPWIDAKEEMPKDGQDVDVLCSDGLIREASGCHFGALEGFMVDATQDFILGTLPNSYVVTHWRNLTNPSSISSSAG